MKIRPAVLIIENDSILTMQYSYGGQDVYNLPGGNLEFGEYLSDALAREMEEELSVKVEVGELMMVGEVQVIAQKKHTFHFIFEGKILEGIPDLNPEHTSAIAIKWVKISDLEKVNLYPNIASRIIECLDGSLENKYIGSFNQQWF